MDPLLQSLEQHFGFSAFRSGQREVIEAFVAGRACVGVMPTGTGKSLCYQLPAMLVDGITLVVSPLIALMKDQVDALVQRGIPAAYLNSTQSPAEQRAVLEKASRGELKLLYVAPERFRYGGAMARLRQLNLVAFVVDEAHCISQWGHDFRPDYMGLGNVAAELGIARVAAFTATATGQVREDIVDGLHLQQPLVVVTGFMRENLHLSVQAIRRMREKKELLLRVQAELDGPMLVYCATRKHCEEVATFLASAGVDTLRYHGGLSDAVRQKEQETYLASTHHVMVATNAFGMGVDKPNIRAVIHYDLPGSVEAYYQEAGRAGRDGDPAVCILLFTYADTRIHEFFIEHGAENMPPPQRVAWAEGERRKLRGIVRYAYAEGCRHGVILNYFGDSSQAIGDEGCGSCDHCTGQVGVPGLKVRVPVSKDASGSSREQARASVPPRDLSEDEQVIVQKVLSAVARSRGRLGAEDLARVLRGSTLERIAADPLMATKSYGILAGMPHRRLSALLRALRDAGCTRGHRPLLTDRGIEVMWRRQTVPLAMVPFEHRARTRRSTTKARPKLAAEDRQLFERLRQARLRVAQERGVPAFHVATNRLLESLAAERPGEARAEWLAITGVGERNVDPLREVFQPVIAAE